MQRHQPTANRKQRNKTLINSWRRLHELVYSTHWDPVCRKIVVPIDHGIQVGAIARPAAVVHRRTVGQPGRPPAETSGWHDYAIAVGQQSEVDGGGCRASLVVRQRNRHRVLNIRVPARGTSFPVFSFEIGNSCSKLTQYTSWNYCKQINCIILSIWKATLAQCEYDEWKTRGSTQHVIGASNPEFP